MGPFNLSCSQSPWKVLKPCCEDRVSQLPDEVLVSILSLLTLKEAVATSLISTRWRYLWTYLRTLDFDETSLNLKSSNPELQKFLLVEPCKYVSWVDTVIKSHRGSTIDHFRALLHSIMHKTQVYEWISFALTKRTHTLDLTFLPHYPFSTDHYPDFTHQFYACIHSHPSGTSLLSIDWIRKARLGRTPVKKLRKCPHYSLKEVEFIGFRGCRADAELGRYLLQNAVMLQKFVVNLTTPGIGEAWESDNDGKGKACGRKNARNLQRSTQEYRVCNPKLARLYCTVSGLA